MTRAAPVRVNSESNIAARVEGSPGARAALPTIRARRQNNASRRRRPRARAPSVRRARNRRGSLSPAPRACPRGRGGRCRALRTRRRAARRSMPQSGRLRAFTAAPAAAARSDGTATTGSPVSCARPFTTAHPIRRPVKLPGPSPTTMPSRSRGGTPTRPSVKSTSRMISAAWRRAPWTCAPAIGRRRPRTEAAARAATLAMSVAVSIASHVPVLTFPPRCAALGPRRARAGNGDRAVAPTVRRSGHSMSTLAPSRVMSSKPRSRASSGERKR